MTRPAQWLLVRHAAPACLAILVLLLAGCGATIADGPSGLPATTPATTPAPTGYGSTSDYAVPPIILRNPAPAILDASMYVTFDQRTGDTQLMTEVSLGFQSGGQFVQFTGDERLTCDGDNLSIHNRDAVFQIMRAPAAQVAGTTIHCVYAAANATAGVAFQVPQPPTITSPLNGASIPRGSATLVSYRYDAATGAMLGIVALAPGSVSPKALARMNTPAPSQATVDTSHFSPGPGSLVLTMTLTPHITGSGAPFKSLHASGSAMAQANVTWT